VGDRDRKATGGGRLVNLEFLVSGKPYRLSIEEKTGEFTVTTAEGAKKKIRCRCLSPNVYVLDIEGRSRLVRIAEDSVRTFVKVAGREVCLEKPSKERTAGAADSGGGIGDDGIVETPMPGKIVKVNVKEEEKVKKGTSLLVVESMKMEHAIYTPWDAVVRKVHVKEGDQTHLGKPLMIIEKIEA
jgi:biotin carboxyl carrier protein